MDFIELFYKDIRRNDEWDLYLIHYQNMTAETFLTFEEWRNPKPKKEVEKDKILQTLKDVRLILKANKN